jgi:hypothetical protein
MCSIIVAQAKRVKKILLALFFRPEGFHNTPRRSFHGPVAAEHRPLLPAEHEDRDGRGDHDLRDQGGKWDPEGRIVVAQILPEIRDPIPLAPAPAMGPVEGENIMAITWRMPPVIGRIVAPSSIWGMINSGTASTPLSVVRTQAETIRPIAAQATAASQLKPPESSGPRR